MGAVAWAPLYESVADAHWTPENLLYGFYNDTVTAHDKDTCVAYDAVSNRNAVAADADGNQFLYVDYPKGCVGKQCSLAARVQLDELTPTPIEEATLTYRCAGCLCASQRRAGRVAGLIRDRAQTPPGVCAHRFATPGAPRMLFRVSPRTGGLVTVSCYCTDARIQGCLHHIIPKIMFFGGECADPVPQVLKRTVSTRLWWQQPALCCCCC